MQLNINGKVAAIVAASAVACAGLGLAVSQAVSSPAPQAAPAAKAVTSPTAANPTPTAPAPQNKIIINNNPVSPNVGVPANPNYGAGQFPTYEADIANAGIAAPAGWLDTTGEQLCTDWAAGEGTSQTDPQLLAGGIYQQHLAIFDELTNNDLCPGLTPGP